MFELFEVVFYTLIQAIRASWINTFLFLGGAGYYLFKLFQPYFLRNYQRLLAGKSSLRQAIKRGWKGRKAIDWEQVWKQSARGLFKWVKLLIPKIIALVSLILWNILFRIVYMIPFVKRERKRFDKEMKPILYFKSYRSFVYMGLGFSFIAFILTNYLVTVLRATIRFLYFSVWAFKDASKAVNFDLNSLLFQSLLNVKVFLIAPILAFPLFLLGLVIAWKSAWINFEQFRDYNNNEEGDDRFVTVDEIRRQYKKIPNKALTYPGEGGAPVFHELTHDLAGQTLRTQMLWQNKTISRYVTNAERILGMQSFPSGYYYIEDKPTNLLGIGMTRSGKGEGQITTAIDINSRAKLQPSLVLGDPKGEHYQASYKTMRQRGYEVDVLSFQNMDWSMSYNPLALAIAAAKKGYYEKTQTYVNAVAESIFPKQKGGEKGNAEYFRKSSISLFNALTMALMDRANETYQNGEEDAWDTITIPNVAKFLATMGSEEVFVDGTGEVVENPTREQQVSKKSKITVYFDNLRQVNQKQFSKFRQMADIEFRASDFGGDETKGNVYSSMMTGINLFLQDNVAKLTSKNSIDLESFGFPRRLSVKLRSSTNSQLKNEFKHKTAKVTITGLKKWGKVEKKVDYVKQATALVDGEGYLTYAIEPKLPDQFTVTIDFNHKNNGHAPVRDQVFQFSAEKVYRRNGDSLELDEYTKKPILDHINITVLKNKEDTQNLLQESDIELIYSDKPKVIYLVTPPNRTEYNGIVSLFLDQLYNANYELALTNGRKCINRILHILDEFTNMPAIPHMDTKISIGLGQNILYYLWIQNLEQLYNVYGQNVAQTIMDNCSLKVYVKTTSPDTNKRFSGELGTRTITRRRRSSNILDEANPNVAVENPKQELLTPTQLAKLQEGEAVILRGVKGRDNVGRKVTTDPIFAHDKNSFPYKYMFLQEEFDTSMTLADIPVESAHRELELQEIAVDAGTAFNNIIDWRQRLTMPLLSNNGETPKLSGRHGKGQKVQSQSFTSTDELFQAAAASVIQGDYDYYDDGDDFFADEVI